MTDTVVARGPYEAKVPRSDAPRGGYKTAEQELAEALEGTAPHLANRVAGLVGPQRTLELAKAVRRATSLAVRRHAAERLSGALALVEQGLDGIPPECGTADDKQVCHECRDEVYHLSAEGWCDGCVAEAACTHSESLYGRCVSCGMPWEKQAEQRRARG